MHGIVRIIFSTLAFAAAATARAQEADLCPLDLNYSQQKMAGTVHMQIKVDLGSGDTKETYHYDRYPGDADHPPQERIQYGGVLYIRLGKGAWLRSDNGPREPISDALEAQMDSFVAITNAPFIVPDNRDVNQGLTVWKSLGTQTVENILYYIFERGRENPGPKSKYWRFAFMKPEGNPDGKLLLVKAAGQLRYGKDEVPTKIVYEYLTSVAPPTSFPPPPATNAAPATH
jgi:hypothetical protein